PSSLLRSGCDGGNVKDKPVMSIKDLVVGFGDQTVLDHLSLDVRKGEILGVVGKSGGGKSVLLSTIIGLLPKWHGKIEVLGVNLDTSNEQERRALERRWGVLFQQGALFSSLTVRQNVQVPMRENLEISQRLMDEMALAKLEMVGLTPVDADKYPAELSGGMTKRAALARALALDPEIVFLDEPTSGLDPITAGDFDALIKTLQGTLGLTVYMNTHDLESLYTVCDRIAALADGRIVALGPMETMLECTHPWVQTYFQGKRGGLFTNAIGELVDWGPNMETRARYALIGAFMLAVIAASFAFVYWLENKGGFGQRAYYQLRFDSSVSGLQEGSAVLFNGIRVGEVTGLTLDPGHPDQVVATVGVVNGTPVRSDTKVGIESQGLTGGAAVTLTGGDASSPPVSPENGELPVLSAEPGAGQDWQSLGSEALRKLNNILSDNADNLHSAIANFNTF